MFHVLSSFGSIPEKSEKKTLVFSERCGRKKIADSQTNGDKWMPSMYFNQ